METTLIKYPGALPDRIIALKRIVKDTQDSEKPGLSVSLNILNHKKNGQKITIRADIGSF